MQWLHMEITCVPADQVTNPYIFDKRVDQEHIWAFFHSWSVVFFGLEQYLVMKDNVKRVHENTRMGKKHRLINS